MGEKISRKPKRRGVRIDFYAPAEVKQRAAERLRARGWTMTEFLNYCLRRYAAGRLRV